MNKYHQIFFIGLIVVVLGLLAFQAFRSGSGSANISTSLSVHGGSSAPALDFSLAKLGGGTISLSEYRGKKPVVVDFWASWCPNCRRDMPNLNRFYEKYKDKVEVIGVNLQERSEIVADFISSRGISFPIALDPNGEASLAFGIRYTNTHFLIDREGNLTRTIPGDIQESDILSLIPLN